jgi:LacI family transcriptional regulator
MHRPRRTARRGGDAPTIADVARVAGVSPMTVSRVINREGSVRASTREAVESAIAELNYLPNRAARSLAGAGPMSIGLLYSNPSENYLSAVLVGSLEEASRAHAQLVVEKCELGDHELEVARDMIESGIGGILLPSPLGDSAELIATIVAEGVPAVVLGSGTPTPELHAVSIDERAAAAEMTRHIIALGHRRIGFITGSPAQTVSARRLEGFRTALAEAGLDADPALIADGLFSYRSGLEAARILLDAADRPTAIFASNDDMAAATIAVAHQRGLDVPGDLTVCGFDDTTLATTIWPELTTVHQPIADMARAAIRLDHSLTRRESDGPPAQRVSA